MNPNIKDKVVIITGASSGIGEASALLLAENGAKLVLGARRIEKIEELVNKINLSGASAIAVKTDVTIRKDCENLAKLCLEKYGRIDILINNAGIMPLSFLEKLKVEEWDKMIDTNIKGILYCFSAVLPTMKTQNSGHIVNISSLAGRVVMKGGVVYCATKFAVTALSEGMRQELTPRYNIRVTCIEPGAVETELRNSITDEDIIKNLENRKQFEYLQAKDIAESIVFAVSQPKRTNINEILILPTEQN